MFSSSLANCTQIHSPTLQTGWRGIFARQHQLRACGVTFPRPAIDFPRLPSCSRMAKSVPGHCFAVVVVRTRLAAVRGSLVHASTAINLTLRAWLAARLVCFCCLLTPSVLLFTFVSCTIAISRWKLFGDQFKTKMESKNLTALSRFVTGRAQFGL
jgi:hypothetical protein